MFSAMSLNRHGDFCEEGRNFERYEDLIYYLFYEGVLIDLDGIYTSDGDDYWRVIIYEHEFANEVLDDTMEYETFYPFDEE